jgi:superoxide reductase
MVKLKELMQEDDWKKEKHVPVIEVKKKEEDEYWIKAIVGKEIEHPNKTEHHIEWIKIYFKPKDGKYPYQVGEFIFSAHGASVEGPDTSDIHTAPHAVCHLKTSKSGTIIAESYCNIHGLWTQTSDI